jgi:hypothetical protein
MSLPIRRTQAAPWLKDGLWRKAQAVPSLDLRFADSKALVDSASGQNLITFTRASSATYIDSTGTLQTATTNVPRFDHNPITGESLGLLSEEARTNLLLNSATLATQSVTVTAVAYTLSFYGTGTVTLSGASIAGPVTGTGAFPTRTTLTFTPAAGSLTLTVSGSVVNAQLEAGGFATSYIPTTGATATRAADFATITGANFNSFYNQAGGTLYAECRTFVFDASFFCCSLNDGTGSNRMSLWFNSSTFYAARNTAGAGAIFLPASTMPLTGASKGALAFANADVAVAGGGGTVGTATNTYNAPIVTRLEIGQQLSFTWLNSTIRRLTYFPARLPNTTLQRMTQ